MKKIIVFNHKSELILENIKDYILSINEILRSDQLNIICPSNVYMPYYNGKYNFFLGSQNISSLNINGETTGSVLKSVGVKYVLIGVSDRINTFYENSKLINEKIKEALKNNLIPLIFIGENFYNYELKKTDIVISKQIKEYLKDIKVEKDLIFVYSPDWDFKGKQIPKLDYIEEVIDLIKNLIKRNYNVNIKVLYNGNISKETIKYISKISNLDGYILDKVSTDLKEVKQILDIIE